MKEELIKRVRQKAFATRTIRDLGSLTEDEILCYSKMKYSDPVSVKKAAIQIAGRILCHRVLRRKIESDEKLVITSSAFGVVPTVSYAITREVTKFLQSSGIELERIKFARQGDFATNHYGTLSAQQRQQKMAQRRIVLSPEDEEKLASATVIVLDDIKVSGSHEDKLHQLLLNTRARDWYFVYLYKLDPEFAQEQPQVEEHLNRAAIGTVHDLLPFFKPYLGPDLKLRINARVLKFILTLDKESEYDVEPEVKQEQLKEFFSQLEDSVLVSMYRFATSSDGYHLDPKFAVGIKLLEEEISGRTVLLHRLLNGVKLAVPSPVKLVPAVFAGRIA